MKVSDLLTQQFKKDITKLIKEDKIKLTDEVDINSQYGEYIIRNRSMEIDFYITIKRSV